MSNREIVLDVLPWDAPLEDIAREVELPAEIRIARYRARKGDGIAADDASKLAGTWTLRQRRQRLNGYYAAT